MLFVVIGVQLDESTCNLLPLDAMQSAVMPQYVVRLSVSL